MIVPINLLKLILRTRVNHHILQNLLCNRFPYNILDVNEISENGKMETEESLALGENSFDLISQKGILQHI